MDPPVGLEKTGNSGIDSILYRVIATLEAEKERVATLAPGDPSRFDPIRTAAAQIERDIDEPQRPPALKTLLVRMKRVGEMATGPGIDPYAGFIQGLKDIAGGMGGKRRRGKTLRRRKGMRKTGKLRKLGRGGAWWWPWSKEPTTLAPRPSEPSRDNSVLNMQRQQEYATFDKTADVQILRDAYDALAALQKNTVPGYGTLVIKSPGRLRDLFKEYGVEPTYAKNLWDEWDRSNDEGKKRIETKGFYFNGSSNPSNNIGGELEALYSKMMEVAGIKQGGKTRRRPTRSTRRR
jgi:hypothetical protein